MTQLSATQIDTYQGCPRKWAFRYISDVPKPPQGESAALGSELHTISEDYLSYGKKPDRLTKAGEMFIEGLRYLPSPGVGGVEGEYVLTVAGISYVLKVDYRGPLPASAEFMGKREPVDRVVLDHKSSKSPKRYGIWNAAGFLAVPQPVIYAAADIVQSGDKEARLRWLYYQSKGAPWAKPSDAILCKSQVSDAFGAIVHPTAEKLVQLYKTRPDPLTVEPNPSHCDAYGGCPYKGTACVLSDSEVWAGVAKQLDQKKENRPMAEPKDLMSLLSQKPGAAAAIASPSTGATATARDGVNAPEAQAVAAPRAATPARSTAPAGDLVDFLKLACREMGEALIRIGR